MNNNLREALAQMSEEDYQELHLAKSAADRLRHIMRDFNLSVEQVAARFNCTQDEVRAMINFYYDFTLRDIAKLNSYCEELVTEQTRQDMKEQEIWQIANRKIMNSLNERMEKIQEDQNQLEALGKRLNDLQNAITVLNQNQK
jgi:hypothetical protein